MERRRFSQTMASEWQTAFVKSLTKCHVCLAHCRQELQQKSWKLQDFFFKTETKTKCSRPRLHDPRPRPRPRLSFLSSRRL